MNSISQKKSKSLSLFFICCVFLFSEQLLAQCSMLAPLSNVCVNGGSVVLTGGTPLGGIYFGPGVTGGSFNPVAAGGAGIYAIGYEGPACGDTAYQNITVLNNTSASFANPGPFCSNADSVVLTGGSPVPPPGSSYYYGPGINSSNGKFDPGIGGGTQSLNYVFEDGNGCRDTAAVTVTIHNVVAANFTGLDTAYCLEDPSPVALTGISPSPGTFGPSSLVTGTNFNIPATPGWYEVYYFYTDGNGCTDTAFKMVRIRPKPSVTFTIDPNQASKCDKDPAFSISMAGASPPGGTFSGTGIIATPIFDPATSGVGVFRITYTAQDAFGCENVDSSQFITVNPSPTVSFTLPVESLCSNEPPIFLPNGVINGNPGPGVYSGPGVSGSPPYTFDPQLAGPGTHTISFTGTAVNGCSSTTSRTIKVNAKPNVVFTNTIKKCANDTAFTLNVGLPLGGTYFGTGVLPDGKTYDPGTTTGPGQYQLFYTYTDTNGCKDTNQQFVTLDTFPEFTISSIPNPANICFGDSIELEANAVPSTSSFSWAPNLGDLSASSGDNIIAFPAQDKNITITSIYKNCSSSSTFFIHVIQPVTASVSGDLKICYGDETVITASGGSDYEWSTGDNTSSINVTPIWDTTYSVIALSEVDGNGKQCTQDTTEVKVIVDPLPIVSAGIDTTAFIGDLVKLTGWGATTYAWSGTDPDLITCPECISPVVKALPDEGDTLIATFWVVGTDDNGCSNNDTIRILLDEKIIVFVPTAFSPNDDGANDSLYVRAKGVKSINFQVFNRRGEEVFTTTNINQGWDGTFEGSPLNKEVFVYYLNIIPYIKPPFKQTGSVTLVR